jgi:hypothetical protein
LTVEPCLKGTKKDSRHIYNGYFMCLAPEDKDGNAVDDEEEYAIEAISLTWEKGEKTTASAFDRNIDKKPVSSTSQGSRLDHLFDERVSKGRSSPTECKYNRPHEPKAVNPGRTVKRVRHKDVCRRLRFVPREVDQLNQKITNALVNMVNHHLAYRDSSMPQPAERMGGWELSPIHPQPCIKDDSREGTRLRSCHQKHLQAQRVTSHSTQTPRFGLGHTTPVPNQVSRPRLADPSPTRERPFLPAPALKRRRTHDSPSDQRRDYRRRVHFMEDSRRPMSDRSKHERLQQAKALGKGKEVRQSLFENCGRNQQDQGRALPAKFHGLSDDSGPSTSSSHPTHRCSKCDRLGHYGTKCLVLEVQQPPSTKVKPSRIPAAIAKTLASNMPHGPHMGKKRWDDPKWDTSGTDNMSDDEEAPSRHHVDRLDKAGI